MDFYRRFLALPLSERRHSIGPSLSGKRVRWVLNFTRILIFSSIVCWWSKWRTKFLFWHRLTMNYQWSIIHHHYWFRKKEWQMVERAEIFFSSSLSSSICVWARRIKPLTMNAERLGTTSLMMKLLLVCCFLFSSSSLMRCLHHA